MHISYDKEQLYGIAKDFNSLTKIKIVVFDTDYNVIVSLPEEDGVFCSALQNKKASAKLCEECTKRAMEHCRKKSGLNIYRCHAGLTEAVSPIKVGDITVGYMMLGQIIEKKNKREEKEKIIEYASKFIDANPEELFKGITTKTSEQIHAAAKIMESCICYILMRDIIKRDNGSTAFSLDAFIVENISSPLTVEQLCEEFNLSRNSLYKISKQFFGMPIAEYIRIKRIKHAERLIREGADIKSAAYLAGFCDYTYFSKVFKNKMGYSPGKIKKKALD